MRAKLHVCNHCAGELCQAVDWHEEGEHCWWVKIRCPECETTRSGTFSQRTIEAFDDEIERGTDVLLRLLHRLVETCMVEDAAVLHASLACNALLPEDFH